MADLSLFGLRVTGRRLALLRAARDGHVVHWPAVDGFTAAWTALERPGHAAAAAAVTARVQEQITADWVRITDEPHRLFGRKVRPTVAGAALLRAADAGSTAGSGA